MSQDIVQPIVDSNSAFKNQPLDLQTKLLRLIEVLPWKGDGQVRCTIKHVTTDATYTCLSYVWDPTELGSHVILLNNRPFFVRKNLWDFLSVASLNKINLAVDRRDRFTFDFSQATKSLWIDALCIDQENVSERNHQVQQMGEIYSYAQHVLAWLGHDQRTATFLRYPFFSLAEYLDYFWNNEYWHRAWITQELVGAKDVWIVAAQQALHYPRLLSFMQKRGPEYRSNPRYRAIFDVEKSRDLGHTLIENVMRFKHKRCSDLRDRIYSLLYISIDGARIKVNYDSSIAELVYALCLTYKPLCLCDAANLEIIFGILGQKVTWKHAMKNLPALTWHISSTTAYNGLCCDCGTKVKHHEHERELLAMGLELIDPRIYCLCCSHKPNRKIPHLLLALRNTSDDVEVFRIAGKKILKMRMGIRLQSLDTAGNAVFSVPVAVYYETSVRYYMSGEWPVFCSGPVYNSARGSWA
jgi:hypothetical protein